jgi:hypothetical protein
VSRNQVFNFSPKNGRIHLARTRLASFLLLLAIGASYLSIPIATSHAVEGELVDITGLNISAVDGLAGADNRHIVQMQGTFTNTTEDTISRLELNLVSTPAIKTRTKLAELISDPTISRNIISSDFSAVLNNIAPGSQRNWQITFIGEEVLGVNASGVYALGVKPDLAGNFEATVVTTPWFFNADIKPTNVAFVIPLTTLNNHLANGEIKDPARDLAEAQRLTNLILNNSDSKISWLQDSALSGWVSQLTESADSDVSIKLGSAIAELKPAGFLPFGSADLAALSVADQQRDLSDAIDLTRVIVGDQPVFYAPTQGAADSKTVSLLSSQGIRTIVSNEFMRGNARVTTPAVATSDSNPVLVHDLAASSCLIGSDESAAAFFKTITCIKSEIGMMTAESPQKSRSIIVLAPNTWKVSSDQLSKLIAGLSEHNWMQLAQLDLMAATKPTQNFVSVVGDNQNQLARQTIRQADKLSTQTETFSSVFVDEELVAGLNASRILGFSELWGSDGNATNYLSENLALIDTYLTAISIQGSSRVTTPAEKSEIPITIVNDSERDVSVSIDLTSTATSRFSAVPTELIQVGSGQRITVPVAITLIGAGVVDVQAALIAPNGERFGEVKKMQISSAAYSQFARTLVWGAFGLLVLLALSNFVKRRKDQRQLKALES